MNELITVRFTPLDSSLDRVALLTRQVSLHDVVDPHHAENEFPNTKNRFNDRLQTQ